MAPESWFNKVCRSIISITYRFVWAENERLLGQLLLDHDGCLWNV